MRIPLEDIQNKFFESIYRQTIEETPRFYNYSLERGRKILESTEESIQYLVVYGGMHYHKLVTAFQSTQFANIAGRSVEIIDWGSGIATASCILIDYLINSAVDVNIERITLVEPSLYATDYGCELLVNIFQNNADTNGIIRVVNKSINNLDCNDFITNSDNIKIHLFSNIIDVQGIDLNLIYQRLIDCFQGINRIICTSPYNYEQDRTRLDTFFNLFPLDNLRYVVQSADDIIGEVFVVNNWEFVDRRITRYEKQFTIDLTPF